MLIGIAGKAGAGKDTTATWLLHNGVGCNHIKPLAFPIKWALKTLFGWSHSHWENREWKETIQPDWGFSPRQAAQNLGTEWRDTIDPSKLLWCKWFELSCSVPIKNYIVPDIRFPHEQDWIHSHGGKVIYIERTDIDEVHPHISENSIDMDKVDLIIYNRYDIDYLHTVLSEAVKEGFFK